MTSQRPMLLSAGKQNPNLAEKKIWLYVRNFFDVWSNTSGELPQDGQLTGKAGTPLLPKRYLLTTLQPCALFVAPSRASECQTQV